MLHFLIEEIFQTNAEIELVESGHLSRPELSAMAGLLSSNSIFGIFRQINEKDPEKYVIASREAALLYYFLRQPSKLPNCAKLEYDDEMNKLISRMVSGKILKIKQGDVFLTGIAASRILYKSNAENSDLKSGRIADLSKKAIQYVLQLKNADIQTIASRLYMYNSIPYILNKYHHLNDIDQIEKFLWNKDIKNHELKLGKPWFRENHQSDHHWIFWTRYTNEITDIQNNNTFKIYISPALDQFPEVFTRSVKTLSATKAFSFKTGGTVHGLLRPDKFIVYFRSFQDLMEAATLLNIELKGFHAQPVPFTAELNENGLLSWGVDPPHKPQNNRSTGGSWRTHVVETIAKAVSQARSGEYADNEVINHIICSVALEGIDPDTWSPSGSL